MLTYNEQTRQYERDGVVITAVMLRELIDKLTTYSRTQAKRLGRQLEAGTITPEQFAAAMSTLLASAHIIAASVGRGGRNRVTDADYRKIDKKVEWQRGYLKKFVASVAAGTVIAGISARAASYISAIYPTFANTRFDEQQRGVNGEKIQVRLVTNSQEGCSECAEDEAQGWMPVEDMGEIGSRICGDFCKCDLVFSDE